MAFTITDTQRNANVDSFVDSIDAGSAAGTIEFLNAAEDTVLVICTFGDPAFGAAASGSAAANAVTSGTAAATGAIARARIKDSSGAIKGQHITVTATGGGGEIEIDDVDVVQGETVVAVDSLTVSQAAS